jgi:hypothetical protein
MIGVIFVMISRPNFFNKFVFNKIIPTFAPSKNRKMQFINHHHHHVNLIPTE